MKLLVSSQVTIFVECEVEVDGDTKRELFDNASLAFRKELENEYGWVDFDSVLIRDADNENSEGEWY